MIKIAFSGIPQSGKSTILAEIKKVLAMKSRVEEVDDVSYSTPFDADQFQTFPVKFYCMTSQINHENLKAAVNPEILLCDRSILDYWAEWKKSYASQPGDISLEEKAKVLFSLYRFWIHTYDLIVHLRVDPKMAETRKQQERFEFFSIDELLDLEEWYSRIIREDGINTLEIWNQQSVDECAQLILKEIFEQLLLE